MITRVVYNNKAFKMLDEYEFSLSNSEVTFNDITIDFSGCTIEDIPFKYQEIKIMKAESEEEILSGTVVFSGFLDEIKLSEMKCKDEYRELTLTLLSPLSLATVRTVTITGTSNLETAIRIVLEPLIADGFTLREINLPTGERITTNFVLETIENCMNSICNKKNLFWSINEKKEISVNSIDYMFGLPIKRTIREDDRPKGFLRIQPTIENVNYANIINIKNVRLMYKINREPMLFYSSYSSPYAEEPYPIIIATEDNPKIINNGDLVEFINPIVVSEASIQEYMVKNETSYGYNFGLNVKFDDGSERTYYIGIPQIVEVGSAQQYIVDEDITFSDEGEEEGEIVLQRDDFFTNLITGFKWNGEDNVKVTQLISDTALRYTTMRFIFSAEINKLKGVISESGQVERTVDFNEKWAYLDDLISYARSLIVQNSKEVNQVELEFDQDPELKIGDIIEIDEPKFLTQGNFAVTEVKYSYNNPIEQNWTIIAKSGSFLESFIDLFRPSESQEETDKVNTVVLSEFVEEKLKETHTVEEI